MSKALTRKLVLIETSFKKTNNYINDIKIKLNNNHVNLFIKSK